MPAVLPLHLSPLAMPLLLRQKGVVLTQIYSNWKAGLLSTAAELGKEPMPHQLIFGGGEECNCADHENLASRVILTLSRNPSPNPCLNWELPVVGDSSSNTLPTPKKARKRIYKEKNCTKAVNVYNVEK